jgi:two-component system NtrC family response regulator
VRVIAATNRNLTTMIEDGGFREDLYYRLAVVPIRVPPLRERTDDIPLLVDHFVEKHRDRLGRARPSVDKAVYSALNIHAWPGNIRELENVIERALVLDRDGVLGIDDLPERFHGQTQHCGNVRFELPDESISLDAVECDLIRAALQKHDWNQTRAAAYLGVTRSTLIYRMQKHALAQGGDVPRPEASETAE